VYVEEGIFISKGMISSNMQKNAYCTKQFFIITIIF